MRGWLVWAAAAVIALPVRARAEAAPPEHPAPEGAPALAEQPRPAAARGGAGSVVSPPAAARDEAPDRAGEGQGAGGRKERGRAIDLTVKGRVYLDVDLDERQGWNRHLGMRSARLAVEGRIHGILTVLEAELASGTPIRDAFIRLDGPHATRLHAGRFKAPFSVRELASSWRLPLVSRGLVNDYVVERNDVGGRQIGAMGAVRPWSGRLEAAVGAFSAPPGADGERNREDLAGAMFYRPWRGVEVGATAYRASAPTGRRDAGTAHVDVELGPLAATVEGMAGHLREGPFTAGTAVATWGFRVARSWRAGPVLGAEGLRLRDGAAGVGWAAIVGAVLHHAEGLKVKVEGERARRPGDTVPQNAVAVQLGARF